MGTICSLLTDAEVELSKRPGDEDDRVGLQLELASASPDHDAWGDEALRATSYKPGGTDGRYKDRGRYGTSRKGDA